MTEAKLSDRNRPVTDINDRRLLSEPLSVEILFALVARADTEDQLMAAYIEAKDVPGGAERDDEFT